MRRLEAKISRACASMTPEVREARRRQWIEENWEAIQSSNVWVAQNGLPLAKYRRF